MKTEVSKQKSVFIQDSSHKQDQGPKTRDARSENQGPRPRILIICAIRDPRPYSWDPQSGTQDSEPEAWSIAISGTWDSGPLSGPKKQAILAIKPETKDMEFQKDPSSDARIQDLNSMF